jgi:hypothetical protein
MFKGKYTILDKKGNVEINNTIVKDGATLMLRSLFRGEATMPAAFYLGLTSASYTFDDATLADMAVLEPAGNGYARQLLTRNTTDWTVQEVNGVLQAVSKIVAFTASANWDKVWDRMFLCDAASGTSGNVYSVSGPAPSPRTVLSGAGPSIRYEFWLRG